MPSRLGSTKTAAREQPCRSESTPTCSPARLRLRRADNRFSDRAARSHLVERLNRARYADHALDATKLERRLFRNDHPRPTLDFEHITNLRIGPVAIAHSVRTIRPPQNH